LVVGEEADARDGGFTRHGVRGVQLAVEDKRHGGGKGDLEMVVKEEMVVVAKGKLLKSRLPRRSEKRKALDAKSAGTQHRHPREKSPHI
jgi:hypothetical protein